jgi:hypothetical protein
MATESTLVQYGADSKALQRQVGVVLLTNHTELYSATLNVRLSKITGISENC